MHSIALRSDFSIVSENFTNISSEGKKIVAILVFRSFNPTFTVNVSFFPDPMRVNNVSEWVRFNVHYDVNIPVHSANNHVNRRAIELPM